MMNYYTKRLNREPKGHYWGCIGSLRRSNIHWDDLEYVGFDDFVKTLFAKDVMSVIGEDAFLIEDNRVYLSTRVPRQNFLFAFQLIRYCTRYNIDGNVYWNRIKNQLTNFSLVQKLFIFSSQSRVYHYPTDTYTHKVLWYDEHLPSRGNAVLCREFLDKVDKINWKARTNKEFSGYSVPRLKIMNRDYKEIPFTDFIKAL